MLLSGSNVVVTLEVSRRVNNNQRDRMPVLPTTIRLLLCLVACRLRAMGTRREPKSLIARETLSFGYDFLGLFLCVLRSFKSSLFLLFVVRLTDIRRVVSFMLLSVNSNQYWVVIGL